MITDLNELYCELLAYEHPHGSAIVSAIDLIEEIKRNLTRDDAQLAATVDAWRQRVVDSRLTPNRKRVPMVRRRDRRTRMVPR
jgi:hypothetical protein